MRFRNNGQYYILEVPVGLAKSNGSLPPGGWLQVTCGLTACTPRAAPGPTLGNEYGKNFSWHGPYTPWNYRGKHLMENIPRNIRGKLFHGDITCAKNI